MGKATHATHPSHSGNACRTGRVTSPKPVTLSWPCLPPTPASPGISPLPTSSAPSTTLPTNRSVHDVEGGATKMDQHDTSSMAHEAPTYPSPTGHQMGEGTHPFYSNQQPIPSAEEMSLQTRLSREVPPNMTDNMGDGHDIQRAEQVMQSLAQAPMHSPQQLAQGGLDPSQDSNYGDGSAKKRTKVSRACDECRRKKVCTLLTGVRSRNMCSKR